jgi:hypothetical protein
MCRFHRTDWDLLPEYAFRPRFGRGGGPMTFEGGKGGSSTPAPDPALVQAQIKSMGIQDSAIQSILTNSNALLPLQQEQLQFGLDSSKTAYEQSQSDRQWLLSRRDMLSGVQDTMVKDATDFNTDARAEELANKAQADVNSAASSARGQSARSMARMGVTPGSGRAAAMDGQLQLAQTASLAGAANKARSDARTEGYALTDRANNALAGYPSMSSAATGSGASYAASGVGLVNSSLAGQNSGYGSAATVAGQLGTNASSMWGQQANYSSNMQQQSNLGGIGSIMGGAASLYSSGIFSSDPRLKENVVRVKDDPRGFGIYEFSYKNHAGPTGRFRGVMADEVERFDPGAVAFDSRGYLSVNYGRLGLKMVEVA